MTKSVLKFSENKIVEIYEEYIDVFEDDYCYIKTYSIIYNQKNTIKFNNYNYIINFYDKNDHWNFTPKYIKDIIYDSSIENKEKFEKIFAYLDNEIFE